MSVIGGLLVAVGCILVSFAMSGGSVGSLLHPWEFVSICGAAFGALIVMSPKKALIDMFKGVLATLKGTPYDKQMYSELFKLGYDLLRVARRDGMLALDRHVNNPHESDIFSKYPKISHDHHAVTFICDGLSPIIDGSVSPEQIPGLLEAEIHVLEEEHHAPVTLLTKTADALPAFGIVAAVLGIVITMQAIDGPVEEIGHKVGSALVGTFLGVLLSYGLFAPLAARLEYLGHEEIHFFRTIATIIVTFASECSPKVAIEQARRGVGTAVRPNRAGLEEMYKEVDAS
jgi:chemotaxis protein MotA